MTQSSTPTGLALVIWLLALAALAIGGTFALACIFPFAAVAAIAAMTLPARASTLLVGTVWLTNQLLGFSLMGYPHTLDAFAWGGAIAGGAFAALAAARMVSATTVFSGRAALALASAFGAYEGILAMIALGAGGLETFAPAIVARVALNDLVWFVALGGLYMLLAKAVLPRFALHAFRTA